MSEMIIFQCVSTYRNSGSSRRIRTFECRNQNPRPYPLAILLIASILWCSLKDLNPQPTDYKSVALPIVLRKHLSIGPSSKIRTYDPLLPKQMRYQTALYSVGGNGETRTLTHKAVASKATTATSYVTFPWI